MPISRGDIHLIDFDPSLGAEAMKEAPAIVVSNEGANQMAADAGWGVINVVPLTTNTATVRPYQVLIPADGSGLGQDSKAQAEQITAVSIGRVGRHLGVVPARRMDAVDDALRFQLAL